MAAEDGRRYGDGTSRQYINPLPELSARRNAVKLSSFQSQSFAAAVPVPSCHMGFMRFLVPSDERLRDEAVQRAYLMGMDYVPWASQAAWDGQVLTVEREVRESGMLAIPWTVPGHGEYVLQTTSLVERRQPYLLQLELARGTLHRLRSQLSNWRQLGYRPTESTVRSLDAAHEAFIVAATRQAEVPVCLAACDECQRHGFDAAESASLEFSLAAIQSRRLNQPLPTLLGLTVESPPLDGRAEKWLQTAFNTAHVSLCWSEMEQISGTRSFAAIEHQLRWCREQGLKIIAGPLFRPSRRSWPAWLDTRGSDFAELHRHVVEHVDATVTAFQGKVHAWHAVSGIVNDGEIRLSEEQRLRLTVSVIETIRKADSRTPVIVSFDQPWGEYMTRRHFDLSPLHYADMLVRSELGVSGLGLEINFGYGSRATWPRDLLEVSRLIDHWSLLGLPLLLFVTAPSDMVRDPRAVEPSEPCPRLGPEGASPEWQRAFADRFTTVVLARQAVHSVVWNQGRDELPHDFAHGGLFDAAGIRKPAIETLANLRHRFLG
jgi:hypothetical protein